ncbi:phosphotransferase [Puniceicoccus vermicola]|uniref:Phosphotransferase n=1 Tax=Puniceicoccus vermicola TaxID=388746 RepID=A0A7X1B196_9BACT|nr:phosphotransferase [Puniceicoccus vermicola]MBC2602683.1 phosphotransferase [Puniceicoccus vermicola]
MQQSIESIVQHATGAVRVEESSVLQTLWSGYGSIVRYRVEGAKVPSVIVKHVSPPSDATHPRGWNTDISHRRKLHSYEVETTWYRDFANRCRENCRVPHCWAVVKDGDEVVMVLEDLDASGFPGRRASVSEGERKACLHWLAHFHAQFLGEKPSGLWSSGTYWHLETRPDELKVLAEEDAELHAAAEAIDTRLKASPFQTWVHGDAKLANFCFSETGSAVAAVDFQYVGGGCGMKDVAYFIGSCLREEECDAAEESLLDFYFQSLREAVLANGKGVDPDALESDWRALYPVAWTDFHRFLKGWSPGHWKIHSYSERLARSVVAAWKKGTTK